MRECPLCGACLDDEETQCPLDGQPLRDSLPGPGIIDGKYLLERRLGTGGMGAVYRVKHKDLQKTFALKLIRLHRVQNREALARFRVEARALGKLQHPHIVQVTDYGVDPRGSGLPYLVMEFLEGRTLRQVLEDRGRSVPPEEALAILEPIASAVDFAHGCGILHRDLKPQNILLVEGPRGREVKIVDFGLARIAAERVSGDGSLLPATTIEAENEETVRVDGPTDTLPIDGLGGPAGPSRVAVVGLTSSGTVMGTPGYIAPEILSGGSARGGADIYALGVILYEMVVGRMPFEAAPAGRDQEGFAQGPPLPSVARPSLPPELDPVLLAPLQWDPGRRPAKAADIALGLRRALDAARARIWRAREVPRRRKLAAAVAIATIPLFFLAGRLAVVRNTENALASYRFRFLPRRPPDDRIALLSIDEATLKAEPALLTDRADEMGARLQAVMDAGAAGVGVDFLLPERWNQSRDFSTFLLRNQDRLCLSSYITKDGQVLGPELLRGLIMAALGSQDRARSLFGFVNIEPDGDGRIRRASLGFKTEDGGWMYSLSGRAFKKLTGREIPAGRLSRPYWIDYAIDWTRFPKISWKDLSSTLAADPDHFRGRYVLVGGEYEGSQDVHRLPVRSVAGAEEAPGMVVQALIIASLLDNRPIREAPAWMALAATVAVALIIALLGFIRPGIVPAALGWCGFSIAYLALGLLAFTAARVLVPVVTPLSVWAGTAGLVLLVRRRLTFIPKPGGRS